MCYRREEPLLHLPGALPRLFDFPGQDALAPLGNLGLYLRRNHDGSYILRDLLRRAQAAVGPLVARRITAHAGQDFRAHIPQGFFIITVSNVNIRFYHPGVFRLHHMGLGNRRTLVKISR